MAENRKGKDDGLYYFTRGQLAILVTGVTLSSAIIFLLGILVGQRIEERKLLTKDEPLVKIPVPPSASGAQPKEELTFYDTLAKSPTGTQPAPGKAVKEVQPGPKPGAKESKAGAQAEKTLPEKVKNKEVKAAVKEVKIVTKAETPASGQKTAEVGSATTDKGAGQKPWAVQVNAFPHERDAKGLVKKLVDRGYDAYVVAANIKGRTWYRVRVGRLATREEAKALQDTLKKKDSYANAITVSR